MSIHCTGVYTPQLVYIYIEAQKPTDKNILGEFSINCKQQSLESTEANKDKQTKNKNRCIGSSSTSSSNGIKDNKYIANK